MFRVWSKMFETRWRIFFTGGGQKARGKKISKSKKKRGIYPLGVTTQVARTFTFFFFEKYKGTTPPGWSHPGDMGEKSTPLFKEAMRRSSSTHKHTHTSFVDAHQRNDERRRRIVVVVVVKKRRRRGDEEEHDDVQTAGRCENPARIR